MDDSALPEWMARPRRAQGVSFLRDGQTIPLSDVGDSGNAASRSGMTFPTMGPSGAVPDINQQQPPMLRPWRTRSFSSMIQQGTDPWAMLAAMFDELLAHIDHRVFFQTFPLNAQVVPVLARPEENRRYLFIQNTDNADALFIGFGFQPTAINCVAIGAGGFYEPLWIPQNEIWIAGQNANVSGAMILAT